MADLSSLSEEELFRIAGGQQAGGSAVSSMSDDELRRIAGLGNAGEPDGLAGVASAAVQGANRGVSDVVGGPIDLLNATYGKYIGQPFAESITGRKQSEIPGGGADVRTVQNLLTKGAQRVTGLGQRDVRATYEDINELPENLRPTARAGEVAGSTLAMLAPFAAQARFATPASQVVANEVRYGTAVPSARSVGGGWGAMVNEAASNPAAFARSQVPASVGAGAGAYAAEVVDPGSPVAQLIGQLTGGTIGGLLSSGGRAGGNAVANTVNKTLEPFTSNTDEGIRAMTARNLQPILEKAGENPADLIQRLRTPQVVSGLTAGERAQSPTLTGVQQLLAKDNPDLVNAVTKGRQQYQTNLEAGTKQAFEPGTPAALTRAAESQQALVLANLDSRIRNAETIATQASSSVQPLPPTAREALNIRARNILEEAVQNARKTERQVWGRVDKTTPVPPQSTSNAYKSITSEMLDGDKLPGDGVRQTLQKLSADGSVSNTGELIRLRSELLNQARMLRSGLAPDLNNARRMGDLADAVLQDLGSINSPAIKTARDYSYALNERLTRTYAGEVLGTKANGADAIRPALTLDSAVAGNPELAAQRMKELQTAAVPLRVSAEEAPTMMNAARDMRQTQEQFLRAVSDKVIDTATGSVKPQAVDKFLLDNAAVLDQFPQYRQSLVIARDRQRAFEDILSRTGDVQKQVRNSSVWAQIANAGENPTSAISKVLGGANPARDLSRVAKVATQGGEDAIGGLRASVMQHVVDQATGTNGLSYGKLSQVLNNPLSPNSPSLLQSMRNENVISASQHVAIQKMVEAGQMNEAAKVAGVAVKDFGTGPGMWSRALARVVGAKAGTAVAGGGGAGPSLQAAQLGASISEKLAARLPADKARVMMADALGADDPAQLIDILQRVGRTAYGNSMGGPSSDITKLIVMLRASIPRTQSEPEDGQRALEITIRR